MPKQHTIICAACNQTIGYGTPDEADEIAIAHSKNCEATPEQYEEALTYMKFQEIVHNLNL